MDMFETLSRRMAEAPALATLWDTDRKLLASTLAWGRWQAAQAELARVMEAATHSAQTAFAARLTERTDSADSADAATSASIDGGFDLWLAVLNDELLGVMRDETYLAAQRRMVEAGLDFREALALLADEASEWLQLPSRNDFDDLARSVTELKRELRALKRASSSAVPRRAAAPAPMPAKKTRRSAVARNA
jgi:polyhydroxyalkanoate synthase subunit PhaE